MKKSPMYIFFDEIVVQYKNYYKENGEALLISDLQKYLFDFAKTSEIMVITYQNDSDVIEWFIKNNLYEFITNISNPTYKN